MSSGRPITLPPVPSLVVGRVRHSRRRPVEHSFTNRQYQWLVDIDDLPELHFPLSVLARFEAEEHLDSGRLGGGLRGDVRRFLEHRGVELADTDRVLMLSHPKLLGHTFNPLSIFWIITAERLVRAVVFEVHNTYGERHGYLLQPDASGADRIDKDFYVSPFNDTAGEYRIKIRLDEHYAAASIALVRDGVTVFTASQAGEIQPVTTRSLLRTSARHALMTFRVSTMIRVHGIWLWLRRLPVNRRTPHPPDAVR